ncbi:hypothetical protein JYU34_013005 [Plutella xylostella]|uniref:Uncharacterized protein n=1 Tax=Plutella xylostella TaxID=51655 RepID=A0ABQ7QCP5_PLUXY|nr:hypothetical protein JYU34_013005 [Plutella xylostella]
MVQVYPRSESRSQGEALVAALARLDLELQGCERGHPAARLAVVAAEVDSILQVYTVLRESIWPDAGARPCGAQQARLARAAALRSALAAVSARLRAAAAYARAHADCMRDALPAWSAAGHGKSGWERTLACSQAVTLLVRARCAERGSRRVLGAPAAPRAARELRLALDYAFTDAVHDHRSVLA